MSGPLAGIKVLEVESIGPGPFAAMLLADLGANVLRIARPTAQPRPALPVLDRGRAGKITLDLRSGADRERFFDLVQRADALLEGYRPGVMERLGVGPDPCLARNARLIYGRVTGWGRSGPLADRAGHDINYIALTGALHACGTAESGPVPPLNLVGDFGGGGMTLAFGVVCALFEARSSGRGQVVDTAMVDGVAALMAMTFGLRAAGRWPAERAGNLLDGSAYFYRCYECADGGWMAVGAIEMEFRRLFLEALGLGADVDAVLHAAPNDPHVIARIAGRFRERPRAGWQQIFEGIDACVSPVLSITEVPDHPHMRAWGTFRSVDGAMHPVPVPRFGRTVATAKTGFEAASAAGAWGLQPDAIAPV